MFHRFSSRPRRAIAVAAALAVSGSLVAAASPTRAKDGNPAGELLIDVAGDGVGFGHTTEEPWLDVHQLAPGSVEQRDLVLWNTTSQPAALHLQAVDVVDHENDCIRPEQQVPTERCEADGGELSSWVVLEIAPHDGFGATAATEVPTLADLATSPAALPTTIGPGEKLPLTLKMTFLPGAGNDTMTDSVEFDTRITASHEGTEPEVLGIEETRDGDSSLTVVGATVATTSPKGLSVLGRAVALPLTGATLPLWVILLDLLVIAFGAALVAVGRRVRRAAPAPLRV